MRRRKIDYWQVFSKDSLLFFLHDLKGGIFTFMSVWFRVHSRRVGEWPAWVRSVCLGEALMSFSDLTSHTKKVMVPIKLCLKKAELGVRFKAVDGAAGKAKQLLIIIH